MPNSLEMDKDVTIEFEWKKKRGVGGKKKEIQFYESFMYDGTYYKLYDSVYLYKDGEPEPYIGKLIKIWELRDKTKKVKILWFFRPSEISNFLGDEVPFENEVFLASGEGVGLANVNPLEAIAGKCNIVCTSKDSRNLQPSQEELREADYIFYRAFDVEHCKIFNIIDGKIAGVDVKFLFNRKECPEVRNVVQNDSGQTENGWNALLSDEKSLLSTSYASEEGRTCERDGVSGELLVKEAAVVKVPCAGDEPAAIIATDTKGQYAAGDDATLRPKVNSGDKTNLGPKVNNDKGDDKIGRTLVNEASDEDKGKSVKVKFINDVSTLDDRPSKKAKVGASDKLYEEKGRSSTQKSNFDGHDANASAVDTSSEDCTTSTRAKDSSGPLNGPSKMQKPNNNLRKLSNGKLPKASSKEVPDSDKKNNGQFLEVTRRPNADRSSWFKGLPWEERMRTAHQQGTLVLLQNLDPALISAQVEDIIWHGFEEHCTAKMIQRTAISSPHSGQAFVIFKAREVAEMVVQKLNKGCFMLSNGRPLVGSPGTPSFREKNSSFAGHLSVDKIKLMQRGEMKQALSTSHCSQPNTIEYEMALEWCLLQERSDSWWKKLHKAQGNQLRKLIAELKTK